MKKISPGLVGVIASAAKNGGFNIRAYTNNTDKPVEYEGRMIPPFTVAVWVIDE